MALFVAFPAHAIHLAPFSDQAGANCEPQQPPLMGTMSVYIIAKVVPGMTGAQFKVSLPPGSPYVLSSWSVPAGLLAVGDPLTGVQVSTGGCVVGDNVLMTLDLQRIAEPIGCYALRLLPHSESVSGDVEASDCAANFAAVTTHVMWLAGDDASCAPIPPPSEPSPANGATEVALATSLNCALHGFEYSSCLPLGSDWVQVYFGTDPNPPLVGNGGPFPYPVTGLVPATTYYWKVLYSYWGGGPVSSPVWSFTTTNATPVTTSTWGKIKALYR